MTAAALIMAATVPACSSSTSSSGPTGGSKTFTYWSMWKVFPDQDALMRDDSKWYTTVFQSESVAFMTGKVAPQQFVSKLKADSAAFWAHAAPGK